MRFSNIIFDFDHTLAEFGPHVEWRGAIKEIEAIYIEEGIPQGVLAESRGLGFKMMRSVYDYMLDGFSPSRVTAIQERVFGALERYELAGVDLAQPVEGAGNVLRWTVREGVAAAVVTSNGTLAVTRAIDRFGWKVLLAGVFGRDPSLRLKPYPDQNQSCLAVLGWRPEETLLVGDSADDILSAKPLAIFSVGLVSGFVKQEKLLEAGADRIIHRLEELPEILAAK
jgi:phosphoglycolate phosphatase-like HAD superfamily hydrolase